MEEIPMNPYNDNILIASILQKHLEMPVETWVQDVKEPLKPFIKFLQTTMAKSASRLKQSAPYNSNTRQRQCFMQVRWQYLHEKLTPVAQKNMSVVVRIGDYREEGTHTIFWGMNWWGNSNDVMHVFHLFEKIKNGYELLLPDKCSRGAGVQAVFLLSKRYTSEQVLALDHDIKEEIVPDLVHLTDKMTEMLNTL